MKHKELVYTIGTSGKTEGLYDDSIDLSAIGKQTITRATSIDHNPDTQKFDVVLLPQGQLFEPCKGFDKYSHGNQFEVEWLNKCRLAQVLPQSKLGQVMAEEARLLIRLQLELQDGCITQS